MVGQHAQTDAFGFLQVKREGRVAISPGLPCPQRDKFNARLVRGNPVKIRFAFAVRAPVVDRKVNPKRILLIGVEIVH